MAEFITVAFGGAVLGALIGFVAASLLRRIDDHLIEITITTIVAFGSFTLAETLHISGVIAVVIAGLLVGNLRSVSMSATTRVALDSFWNYIGFLGNSMIFLLVGMRIAAPQLWENIPAIGLVAVAVVMSRAVIVAVVNSILRVFNWQLPWIWVPVVTWGGLRGAVSLALALSLPRTLEDRDWIQVVTFGVVLVSLVGQGLTVPPLLSRLGFRSEDPRDYERHVARMQAYASAMRAIETDRQQGRLLHDVADTMRAEYEESIEWEREAIRAMGADTDFIHNQQMVQARRQALIVQRDTFNHLRREGQLSAETLRELIAEVDGELVLLDDAAEHDARGVAIAERE